MSAFLQDTRYGFLRFLKEPDWILLGFLFLFTNQSNFTLKLAGLLLIYIARPNLKLGLFKGRIPPFYPLIIGLSFVNLLLHIREVAPNYLSAFIVGNLFWVFSALAFHQVRLSLERNSVHKTYATLKAFTLLNVLFCIGQLVRIMLETGKLNPFRGLDFPYGMSTGDHMFGFFLENSYYNMIVSSILVVYFLYRKNLLFALLGMATAIIVFGNTGNFIFLLVLLGIFGVAILQLLLRKAPGKNGSGHYGIISRLAPGWTTLYAVPILIVWALIIYLSISPDNLTYLVERTPLKKSYVPADMLGNKPGAHRPDTGRYIDIEAATARLNFRKYAHPSGAPDVADIRQRRALTKYAILHMQGKKLSMLETYHYMKSSPLIALLGAGTGRFSSFAAHRVSGTDSSRLFLKYIPHYVAPAYAENHLLITKYRLMSEKEYYSNANWPENFYNQLFGEYGIVGALLFLIFYVGYFFRQHRHISYGWWITLLTGFYALLCYIFDTMCIMVFYELLMLHNADVEREKESGA
jgi:hypothetical protein